MTEEPQLHDLTRMLLKRMESNPEEFSFVLGQPPPSKWTNAVEAIEAYGRPEDIRALHDAFMGLQFQDALKVLLLPPEEEKRVGRGYGTSGYTPGVVGSSSYMNSAAQSGNAYYKNSLSPAEISPALKQNAQNRYVVVSSDEAKAMGLKPVTVKDHMEYWKKRVGL